LERDKLRIKAVLKVLETELRRLKRDNWRVFLEEVTNDLAIKYNKGLWRMFKWSRKGGY
jgi:hypothetical protein